MDYNTSRNLLILREYGRNVQYMIEHLPNIDDKERRTKACYAIIELMGQLNPHLRMEEYRPKLWDHLYRMAGYDLDIDAPYELKKEEETFEKHPRPAYPNDRIRLKQYGKHVETMIDKAKNTEEEDGKQDQFVKVIGNYMKMVSIQNYNTNVDDKTIRTDLDRLSDGDLQIEESFNLDLLQQSNSHKTPPQQRSFSGRNRRNNNNNNNRSNNNRRNNNSNNNKRRNTYKK